MADTWRSSGSSDSCPLLDVSTPKMKAHGQITYSHNWNRTSPAAYKHLSFWQKYGEQDGCAKVFSWNSFLAIWWVSHTLQHTHHLSWLHGKKAEACNQSWLRCYQAATGCLLLTDLDLRWCATFSCTTTVIYEVSVCVFFVCVRESVWERVAGGGVSPQGCIRFEPEIPHGSAHTSLSSIQVRPKSRLGDCLQSHPKLCTMFWILLINSSRNTNFKLSRWQLKLTGEFIPNHQLSADTQAHDD